MSAAKVLEAALEKAKDKLKGDPDDKNKKDTKKRKGKVAAIAQRLTAVSESMKDDKPDAGTLRKLRSVANELGSMIGSFPTAKRLVKSVAMTPDEFTDHTATEIERAVTDQDVDRLEQIETNVASVTNQLAGDGVEKVHLDVFEDATQKTDSAASATGSDDLMKTLTGKLNELTEAISALKAKAAPPFPPKKPGADGEDGNPAPGDKDPDADKDKKKDDAAKVEGEDGNPAPGDKDPDADKKKDKDADKSDTKKAASGWPSDMNEGRKLTTAEGWGKVQKSAEADDRSFGPDSK